MKENWDPITPSNSPSGTWAASIHRSTFRSERAAATLRKSRQSPPQRILTFFNIQEQAAAGKHCFNLVENLGSSSTRKLVADYDSVASSFSSTRKLVADHETVVSVDESRLSGKRDRDLNVVQTLKDRQNLDKFLERKAELVVRGEKSAQKRLSEAEAQTAANQWDHAQREKIKFVWRNGRENRLMDHCISFLPSTARQ